jgi:LDH2 family malate/lactate/ureidoglycolate dehydrogenase
MTIDTVRLPSETLKAFIADLSEAYGVPRRNAGVLADSLVAANLRGVDSHGVISIIDYLGQVEAGDVNPAAEGEVAGESGACLVYDGQDGLGQVIGVHCTRHAVRLAREHGLGLAVARKVNHFGAAAYWAQRIAAEDMIGIVLCNAPPRVPTWQGREPRVGTNPICMAVPGAPGKRSWLLDMATTTVAFGKLFVAKSEGRMSIPPGWSMDREGLPTTDLAEAFRGFLMPLGGYKGSGLALMVEILCSVLSGGAMFGEIGSIRSRGTPMRASQFYLAIDVERFLPREEFIERIDRLVATIKSAQPATGFDEVLVAGEPEWRKEAERLRDGVPLPQSLWEELSELAARRGVPVPEPVKEHPL